ncbi:DUF2514 family protein [Pseudorhodoferax sp. Leaf274]|uniref:DUF2514 family protein n=1 Tax=Pseudorhodoferax sp. Leaf274 TaxID=1736318 RepID=UPI0007027EF1|nr:DUF2514 family protein [Pseudorhodoferax sp. Leaf274]KQP43900.1 hypothetical protein ASF44_28650 [Pseudorhodoferax sp. Leaf274]
MTLITHGIVAVVAGALVYGYFDARHAAEVGDIRVKQANAEVALAGRALAAEQRERTREQQWAAVAAKEAVDAQTRINALQGDLAASRGAADRLRIAAADAARRARQTRAASAAASASPGVAAADPLDLLVGVLQRHSDELVRVGAYADQLRVAGETCERISDALTP